MAVVSSVPNAAVQKAILAGTTNVTRRVEIYESDGVTLYRGSDDIRVKSGTVSVDYSRDERRNLDLKLDNSNFGLNHNPQTGLWYDKVIKCYRGVSYRNNKVIPSIAILDTAANSTADIVLALRRNGYTDLTFFPSAAAISSDALLPFDVIVLTSVGTAISAAAAALALAAYTVGQKVLSVSNYATSATVPLIVTNSTRASATVWDVTKPAYDTPFSDALAPYSTPGAAGETMPTAIRATASAAALTTGGFAAIWEANNQGGKWFHYHPKALSATSTLATQLFMKFLRSSVAWEYTYGNTVVWETQIGEFMIDSIEEPNFPHEISIAGRDYAKKLMLSKFDVMTTFAAGIDLDTQIRAIATNGGIKKFRLASGGAKLTSTISVDRTTSRWDTCKQLAQAEAVEIFFDAQGYLVTRPFIDPNSAPESLTLQTGQPSGNLVSFTKSSDDSQLYNYVVVTGDDTSGTVATSIIPQAVAQNLNPLSPTRIAKVGQRSYYYTSAFFKTIAQCQAYANKLLSITALESFNLAFGSLVFPWIEAGTVVRFVDPYDTVGYPSRYLLTTFSIPLQLEPMTGTAKRVTVVQ